MPHNCRQMRQSYGRGNCVVIGNRYHQKRVYPAIGEISMLPAMHEINISAKSPGVGGYGASNPPREHGCGASVSFA